MLGILTSTAAAAPLQLDSRAIVPTATNRTSLASLLEDTAPDGGRHVLVQLRRIPNATHRDRLAEEGLALLHYIPVRGYLARVDRRALTNRLISDWLEWSSSIPTSDKMSRAIRDGDTPVHAMIDGRVRLVVKTFAGVSQAEARAALAGLDVEISTFIPEFDRFEVSAPPGAEGAIAGLDPVRWVRYASPPPVDDLDGLREDQQVNEVQTFPYSLSGADVDIGQIETGNPDSAHDDLDGRITNVTIESTSDHATHVAGIMIGSGTLSSSRGGLPLQWRGVAKAATSKSWGSGGTYLTDYSSAIATHGIEMSTNSWGWFVDDNNCGLYGDYDDDAPEHDLIITGLYGRRIPIFFSAGNERDDCDCGMSCTPPYVNYANIRPPGATAKNTITVGAKFSDAATPASFSSWGPMDDGRLKPEVVAAGDELGGDGAIRAPVPGDDYGEKVGTSMSAPAAAGGAALFFEDFRTLTGGEPSPSLVKAMFVHTADDLSDSTSFLNPGPDFATGYGRLRIRDSIDQLRSGDWIQESVEQGESDFYVLGVPNDATEVRVTLAWDDPAGAENASPALVNDLDLVVKDESGTKRFPWTLDPANPGHDAVRTEEDHVNPLEQVYVDGVAPGTWSIEVRGNTVPLGPQPYALVFGHDGSVPTGAPEVAGSLALRTSTLRPSHPNPFSPWTTISYSLRAAARVELRVLDVQGRVVRKLVPGLGQMPGEYTYTWRGRDDVGRDVASGVYLVELRAGSERSTTKVVLIR
jgi:subtilisin family serine protease